MRGGKRSTGGKRKGTEGKGSEKREEKRKTKERIGKERQQRRGGGRSRRLSRSGTLASSTIALLLIGKAVAL